MEHEGDTILQKCLSFLTEFVYKEIEVKRLRSIDDMILACEIGLQDNGNEELKDFMFKAISLTICCIWVMTSVSCAETQPPNAT